MPLTRPGFVLALLLVALACGPDTPLPRLADPLALLARPLLRGGSLDVAALRGQVVVLNFWSPG